MDAQLDFFEPATLVLQGELTPRVGKELLKSLQCLERQQERHARFLIESNGGDLESAVPLYHALRASSVSVHGIVMKDAHSSASLVLQGCHRRSMGPRAKMHVHFFSRRITAQVAYNQSMYEECVKSFRQRQDEVISLYRERSGLDHEKMLELLIQGDNGHDLSAKEALSHDLIDDILPHL